MPIFDDWIDKNIDLIFNQDVVHIAIEPRSGFVKQKAEIGISEDSIEFDSNWKYKSNNFPTRVKALAKALHNRKVFGAFQVTHHAGNVTLKKIDQLNSGDTKKRRT